MTNRLGISFGRLWIGAAIVAIGTACTEAASEQPGPWKAVLTDSELASLVAADARIINDVLAKGAPDKKAVAKIRAAALMTAVYAQGAGEAQNGLRDIALKVGKAARDGKFDDVKKLAADMKPGAASPGAKAGAIALQELFELEELMQQFKPERGGGIELEKALQTAAKKRAALTPNEIKAVVPVLLRIAAIAQPCEAFAPAKDEGKKTRADWNKWSREMGTFALDAAKLAKAAKPDDKALKAALMKVDKNCTDCHNVFRDSN